MLAFNKPPYKNQVRYFDSDGNGYLDVDELVDMVKKSQYQLLQIFEDNYDLRL